MFGNVLFYTRTQKEKSKRSCTVERERDKSLSFGLSTLVYGLSDPMGNVLPKMRNHTEIFL